MSASQQSLFGGSPAQPVMAREEYLPPRSRRDDPLSSKKAEAEVKRNGTQKAQHATCLELIKQRPGSTSKELAALATFLYGKQALDRYQIARRLREMVMLRMVRRPEDEPDYVKGQELKWWPVA